MDQFAAMATFVRVVDARQPVCRRTIASKLVDVGQPADFSAGAAFRDRHYWCGPRASSRSPTMGASSMSAPNRSLVNCRDVETMLSRGRNAPSGRIRVSAPALMGRLLLAPLLPEFLRRYPALTVDLLLVDRAIDMVEEDVHLAFRVGHLPDSQIVARKIADLRMIHCADAGLSRAPWYPEPAVRSEPPRLPGVLRLRQAARNGASGECEV